MRQTAFQLFTHALSTVVLPLILVTLCAARPIPGQLLIQSPQEMTRSLTALIAGYEHAAAGDRAAVLANLLEVAKTRHELLAALIAEEPAALLGAVLPAASRSKLPPPVQQYLEQDVEIEGEVEVSVEDRPADSLVHYALKSANGDRFSLHFAARPPDLQTGSRIRVRGVQIDNALALTSGTTSVTTLSAALPNTFGAQKTVVMLVNFQDKATQPYTVVTAQSVVFTTTSNFDYENSYQQTWLTGDVYGWFTIALSSTVCDYTTLADEANQAATAAGVNLSNYTHYVYAFPQNACGWWGLGTVGGSPSKAWVNGSLQLQVVGHEMGHNFGLYHSHSLDCGSTVTGTNCTTSEYGDTLDIMGNSQPGHFNAFQKERLGWLDYNASPPITTVQTSGTYSLVPYESTDTMPKALKILQSTDPATGYNTWYYIECRSALGFDSFLSTYTNVLNGVVVHTGSESSGNTSDLLDTTPATTAWTDPALDVGQSFTDSSAGVTITVLSVSSSGASVSVALGGIAPTSSPTPTATPTSPFANTSTPTATPRGLTITVATDRASYTRGQSVLMTSTVTAGGLPLSSTNVTFVVRRANGTVVTLSALTNANGAATYKMRLKKQDPVGTYQVQASASVNGVAGSATTSFLVN